MIVPKINLNVDPNAAQQAEVDQGSKLGESTTVKLVDLLFPVRLDTAEFVKTSNVKNAIFGGSRDQIGIAGQSFKNTGVYGEGPIGVFGSCNLPTGMGVLGEGNPGVQGESTDGNGVYGHSKTNAGVFGESAEQHGVFGRSHNLHNGGVIGINDSGGWGVIGRSVSNTGISGESTNGIGVHGIGGTLAGFFEGDVQVKGDLEVTGDIRLTNADCAEDFDIGGIAEVEPGTVMILGDEGALYQSHQPYDKRVAGVISGGGDYKPGIVLDTRSSLNKRQPVALLGKVFCKVDAQYGSVEVGDLLTTSATLGHAMKVSEPSQAFGTVIGKALRPFKEGRGLIPILVTLQ